LHDATEKVLKRDRVPRSPHPSYIGGVKPNGETKPLAPAATRATKKISIVVGAVDAEQSLSRCLDALDASCDGLDCEVIVVTAGPEVSAAMGARLQRFRTIAMPGDTLTPMLWSEGMAASTGDVVALTTAHCFVSEGWVRSLVAAIESGAAAVGGPMRLASDASNVDAAIFFLRYSAFLEGRPSAATHEIAGDNCAYERRRIPGHAWSRRDGFWEVDVNRAIEESGDTVAWAASAVAEFGKSFSMRSIARHRFEHGRLFGRSRVSGGESRARILVSSPLVPFVLVSRIARRLRGRAGYTKRFVASLPYILLLATCWASGEAAGAIHGPVADRR
jgi:glycosyl transferase family 2